MAPPVRAAVFRVFAAVSLFMILEARSPNCFSATYVLKRDGQPIGEFRGRWFSEALDVNLLGRRTLHLEKLGTFGSRFVLTEPSQSVTYASAARRGWLSTAWDLELSGGPAEVVSRGFLDSAYEVRMDGQTVAVVGRIGLCEGGWYVREHSRLAVTDLILVGLIYHTIVQRRRRRRSN